MTIYHTHHIIPRHMGGSDEPENLIQLTIEEHAEAHRLLYLKYGKWEDLCAWKGLAGLYASGEAAQEALKQGRIKGGKATKGIPKDPEMQGQKARNMWKLPGMREHLVECRKQQSRDGKNPMQGKRQKRKVCDVCKKDVAVNVFPRHKCIPV